MPLQQLLPNLYRYADTCNVYLLKSGQHALLFDFGSGQILDHLAEADIAEIDWVLHTHHHRDQAQGDYLLNERGIPIAVPEREAALFEHADAFWRLKRVYHNYDVSSIGNTLPRPVTVAKRFRDYERFEWRGYSIQVIPTPGHTKGSVTYLLEVDNQTVAIAGDLIAEPGAVHAIHDLQWQYGFPDGVGAALHSALLIRDKHPSLVAGSHGHPITSNAASALDQLAANLRRLYEAQRELRASRVWKIWPHSVDQPKQRILPHLWANPHSCSNVYCLLSDDGRGILLDYGFPSWDHFAADLRFVEHSLEDLKASAGLTRVEAVIPSHYHDDHLSGLPWLQQEHGVEAWIFENFAEIVQNPAGYNIPCLLPAPIRVDRVLKDGGSFSWDGHSFDIFHMPGHTWWALGMFGTIDGTRVAYTGDNLLAGTISPLRAAAPVYRNKMLVDSIAVGAERLREHEPELILTGHTGAIQVNRQILDDFLVWARELSDAFVKVVSVPSEVNFALDPNWCTLYPYQSKVQLAPPAAASDATSAAAPANPSNASSPLAARTLILAPHSSPLAPRPGMGARFILELRATNHAPTDELLRASLALPPGWTATPSEGEIGIVPGRDGAITFAVDVPPTATGRHVICADVTLGERRFGWLPEAIVDILP
ncbi:MAG: MBL fold metallo-hydrolase [Chloroflexota bacterium]